MKDIQRIAEADLIFTFGQTEHTTKSPALPLSVRFFCLFHCPSLFVLQCLFVCLAVFPKLNYTITSTKHYSILDIDRVYRTTM